MRQVASTGAACPHSERSPAGTPGPGSQTLVNARSIHDFETTCLTPTDGSQAVLGPGSSGLQGRISLIKPEKSREDPKSSAAGERKELMLKRRSLLLVCWAVCMRTHGNEAPACLSPPLLLS